MNLMETAADWLRQQRSAFASEPVDYRRDGVVVATVAASIGKTIFRFYDEDGATVRTEAVDFLVSAADLTGNPRRDDEILWNGGIYSVLAPNNEPCWRWSDPLRKVFRIHTKLTGNVADE